MRMTQFIGLTSNAKLFLQLNAVQVLDTVGEITGMFNEHVVDLKSYLLTDGKICQEYVQAEPWSSGPCIFLALQYSDGTPIEETLWNPEDIDSV